MKNKLKDYLKSGRRQVINKKTGEFGFVSEANKLEKELLTIFYPHPSAELRLENMEDLDLITLYS